VSLTRQEPPKALATGWPVRRMPRWVLLVGAALVVGAVLVSLVHKPSTAERASDMTGVLQEMTADIQSCAGGVSESLTALRLVQAEHPRSSTDVTDGISVAQQGAANCSPANNDLIVDLQGYQVPESLDSFGLKAAVTSLIAWAAPDAEQVQTDVANLLAATTPHATATAQTALSRALAVLDVQRARVDGPVAAAIRALGMHAAPPRLPG
jgi:hypothetical protein